MSKRKKKPKRSKQQADRGGQAAASKPLHQRDDRHALVAMTLTSLVVGLLMIINLDRSTHAGSLDKEQRVVATSLHGWPLVYLHRQLAEEPTFYFGRRLYSWPWPAVDGEQRNWNVQNLLADIAIGLTIAAGSYVLISQTVKRYDRWKKKL